jgi:phosphate transport system substrate-binding protein
MEASMKSFRPATSFSIFCCVVACWAFIVSNACAETIRFSCSNQIYAAFEKDKIAAFKAATGINVDVINVSSDAAAQRMMSDLSDLAATARDLGPRHVDYGFSQIPICRDGIAIIVKKGCGVANLTEKQVKDIFSGKVTNWKSVGGADLPITVVVPSQETAAQKNFLRLAMKNIPLKEAIITKNSTMVLEILKSFPCGAVSFISYSAALHYPELTAIKFNGKAPHDKDYPFMQTYYYVSKGQPQGDIKKFIDFTFANSDSVLKKNGLLPVEP